MSAYITVVLVGRLPRKRNGTDEVKHQIRVLQYPDEATAEYLLKEIYPSATLVGMVTPAAHGYPAKGLTVANLKHTPLRRQAKGSLAWHAENIIAYWLCCAFEASKKK